MTTKILYLPLFITTIFWSCSMSGNTKNHNTEPKVQKESFWEFYNKFYTDSLFQMSRIKFPLKGINTDDMEADDKSYYWTKKKWLMLHLVDTTTFSRKISISDTTVSEKITSKEPGVEVRSKYQNIKGKWFLVEYEDINI